MKLSDIWDGHAQAVEDDGANVGDVAAREVEDAPEKSRVIQIHLDFTDFDAGLTALLTDFRQPLQRRVIASVPSLKDLMILRFPNYGIFQLSVEHARLLMDMLREASRPAEARARVWLYAPGEGAEYWDEYYEQGLMGIGWQSLGDLQQYKTLEDVTAALVDWSCLPLR